MEESNDLSLVLKIVCFVLPIVGLVLYFVYREDEPTKSKSAGVWALAGFLIGVVLKILF